MSFVVLGLLLGPQAHAAKPGGPTVTIPLDPLGYQPLPPRFLVSGGALFTLHFVDERHLLFTFNNRKLISRLPDAEPDDEDRNVTALLLELPSGRILARTDWHTRDHGQYLWPLGPGRFLLRLRSRLTVLDPLAELPSGDAFRQQPFVDLKRRIGHISVSPGGELVAVETVPAPKPPLRGAAASAAALAATVPQQQGVKEPEPEGRDRAPVAIHFYRIAKEQGDHGRERLVAQASGIVHAPVLIEVPATSEGFLDIAKERAGVYLFDFRSHAGKRIELSPYDSSCPPKPFFVSRSEFIAFGCRGSADREELSGFNMRGEENWIEVVTGQHIAQVLVPAPAAGRFALSRIAVANSSVDLENLIPEELTGQEVRVMQSYDGRVLLKVMTTPIQRTAQNFDLSADGRSLAVVRGNNIEVYPLPPLTRQDEKELARANAAAPEPNDAAIRLTGVPADEAAEAEAGGSAKEPTAKAPSAERVAAEPATTAEPANAEPAAIPEEAKPGLRDSAPDEPNQPRKAPSLYDPNHPKPSF